MSDYISRDAAIKGYLDLLNIPGGVFVTEVIDLLRMIPAADVRPVVTCGECKHWFEFPGQDFCSCDRDALLRHRDFWCAGGEPREEEQT